MAKIASETKEEGTGGESGELMLSASENMRLEAVRMRFMNHGRNQWSDVVFCVPFAALVEDERSCRERA